MTARLAAAIVLVLGADMVAGAELGRLFFTPAQRATLDNARKQNIRTEVGSDSERAAPVPQNLSVNGVVRRSDGKNTVWLNNRAITGQQPGGVVISTDKRDNRVRLTVPDSGRSVHLKVGQSVEIVSGTIEEGFSRRAAPKPEPAPAGKPEPTPAGKPGATSDETPKPQNAAPQPRRARDLQDQYEPAPPAQTVPSVTAPAENNLGPYRR